MKEYASLEEQLAAEGQIVTVLHGSSMWPMIRSQRDPVLLVALKEADRHTLSPGTIVAYRRKDRFVVHRVIRFENHHYIIIGDNCKNIEIVDPSELIAVMTGFWRNNRFINLSTHLLYRLYMYFFLFRKRLLLINH